MMEAKGIKRFFYFFDFCFLAVHTFLLVLFFHFKIWPMAYFNIGSVMLYGGMLRSIYKGRYGFFAVALYLEVVVHMILAVYFTGWNNDFQNTLIGINILLFFMEYLRNHLQLPALHCMPLSCISAVSFIGTCVWCQFHAPLYTFPDGVSFMLRILWAVVVFSLTILVMYIYVQVSSRMENQLSSEVGVDKLTGLPNRYLFLDHIEQMRETAGLAGCWLAMLDIDDFKSVNDIYGHNFGDYVLAGVSTALETCGDGVFASRYGGEEFLLLCQTDQKKMSEMLENLRADISRQAFTYNSRTIYITVTIGAAEYVPGTSLKEWIGAADDRMYYGKRHGKNQVVFDI